MLNRLTPGECRICDAADGDALDNVTWGENDTHESEHTSSTAHYLFSSGRVVRLTNGNRWVNREPVRDEEQHLPSCDPEQYDSNCAKCRKQLAEFGAALDRMLGATSGDVDAEEALWATYKSGPESVTDEAYRLVMGDRQSDYNHPSDDFKATGRQWGAVLTNWLHSEGMTVCNEEFPSVTGDVPDVPPRIVALMMAQLKLSRESHKPKRDNRVDAIGYVLCADRIEEGY